MTGAPAVIIILVTLLLIVLGVVSLVRGTKRGVEKVTHRDHR